MVSSASRGSKSQENVSFHRIVLQGLISSHLIAESNFIVYHVAGPERLNTDYWEGGGVTKREGGVFEVLPLRKGGGGGSFSHAEWGAKKVLR